MKWLGLLIGLLVILACGGGGVGGGGGAQSTIVGKVVQVETGGPPNPQATVSAGSTSTLTSVADGSFSLTVPAGATSIKVDTHGPSGIFTFTIPSSASGEVEVGDLWVGPEQVSIKGRILNSSNNQPVFPAEVYFAGRSANTDPDGNFTLTGVAYSSANQTAFWGIHGFVRATGYLTGDLTAQNRTPVSGVITLTDILLSPIDDIDPPPSPFNLWGRVAPVAQAQGTLVTLKQNGVALRTYTVGTDTAYYFWVTPGTYTVSFQNGGLAAPDETITIDEQNEVERRDVTLQ